MPLGIAIPANLEDMALDDLHALHAKIGDERTELKLKHMSIMPTIWAKQAIKDMETRAGFDTVLVMPPSGKKFTVDRAKRYLDDAQEGFIALTQELKERLKRIVQAGKDEE
jgi:hypothetical protein